MNSLFGFVKRTPNNCLKNMQIIEEYEPITPKQPMAFKVLIRNDSVKQARTLMFGKEKAEELESKLLYMSIEDIKIGFIPNVIIYCVKRGLLKTQNPYVVPSELFDSIMNNEFCSGVLCQIQSGSNILVDIDEKTCGLYSINNKQEFNLFMTFHYQQ